MKYLKRYLNIKSAVVFILIPVVLLFVFSGIKTLIGIYTGGNNYDTVYTENDNSIDIEIDSSDFLIPESITSLSEFSWIPYRGVKDNWSQKEVDRFWIKPEIIINETFTKKNIDNMNNIFESIP